MEQLWAEKGCRPAAQERLLLPPRQHETACGRLDNVTPLPNWRFARQFTAKGFDIEWIALFFLVFADVLTWCLCLSVSLSLSMGASGMGVRFMGAGRRRMPRFGERRSRPIRRGTCKPIAYSLNRIGQSFVSGNTKTPSLPPRESVKWCGTSRAASRVQGRFPVFARGREKRPSLISTVCEGKEPRWHARKRLMQAA